MNNDFTKQEIKSLEKYGVEIKELISGDKARGKKIDSLIIMSNGNKTLHDSGYPLIRIIGIGENKNYYNLGWHDHYLSYIPINVDSFGKNIFHIMPWADREKGWFVSESFISCSTFEIGEGGELR
jgi:hypothetical protein